MNTLPSLDWRSAWRGVKRNKRAAWVGTNANSVMQRLQQPVFKPIIDAKF